MRPHKVGQDGPPLPISNPLSPSRPPLHTHAVPSCRAVRQVVPAHPIALAAYIPSTRERESGVREGESEREWGERERDQAVLARVQARAQQPVRVQAHDGPRHVHRPLAPLRLRGRDAGSESEPRAGTDATLLAGGDVFTARSRPCGRVGTWGRRPRGLPRAAPAPAARHTGERRAALTPPRIRTRGRAREHRSTRRHGRAGSETLQALGRGGAAATFLSTGAHGQGPVP